MEENENPGGSRRREAKTEDKSDERETKGKTWRHRYQKTAENPIIVACADKRSVPNSQATRSANRREEESVPVSWRVCLIPNATDKFLFHLSFPLSPSIREEEEEEEEALSLGQAVSPTNRGRASATQIVAVTIPHTRYHNNIRNHRID